MASPEIAEKIHGLLEEEFELAGSDLNPGADLYADLGLDSLDTVDLMVALSIAFGFKVNRSADEERIRATRTLEDLYEFVSDKLTACTEQR